MTGFIALFLGLVVTPIILYVEWKFLNHIFSRLLSFREKVLLLFITALTVSAVALTITGHIPQ